MSTVLALVLLAAPARALPPRWGVGPHLGTTAVPAGSPIAFPAAVRDQDLDGDGLADDVDGDGVGDETTLDKARADLRLGAGAFVWTPGGTLRGGVSGDVGLARRYLYGQVLLTVERSFDLEGGYVNVGGGFGYASARWRGEDPDERLRVPSYPVRGQAGAVVPISDFVALEGRLFAQVDVPLRHRYRAPNGADVEVRGVPFAYTVVGIEVGGSYGLFR